MHGKNLAGSGRLCLRNERENRIISYMSDSRRQPRVSLPVSARVDLGARSLPCEIINVSEGGLSIRLPRTEVPGGPVQVSFRMGLRDAALASIDAEVVNHRVVGNDAVWGLRTLGMDLGTRTRLRDFVITETRAA